MKTRGDKRIWCSAKKDHEGLELQVSDTTGAEQRTKAGKQITSYTLT